MPGAELEASVRDGPVVVARRGDLDVTGAADVEAATAALVTPEPQVARGGPGRPLDAVWLAAACGAHCTPWEGSAIAYWYRVITAGAAAALAGSSRGRMRR